MPTIDDDDVSSQGLRMWLVNQFNWHWLLIEWWQYVLDDGGCYDKSRGDDEIFNGRWWWWLADRWHGPIRLAAYLYRCHCRAIGHRSVRFYDCCGAEPDMHCESCGEDLG